MRKNDSTYTTASPLIETLIEALRCLPGVGPRSAQRMSYYLLQHARTQGLHLADALQNALQNITSCIQCNNFSKTSLCEICSDPVRQRQYLCVVETPSDILAIEESAAYHGLYYVLMGHLSPIDGIGPKELKIDTLLATATHLETQEVILALNATAEGEATAYYLIETFKNTQICISQLAQGIPIGSALEYIDQHTLHKAIIGRQIVSAHT